MESKLPKALYPKGHFVALVAAEVRWPTRDSLQRKRNAAKKKQSLQRKKVNVANKKHAANKKMNVEKKMLQTKK